MNKDDFVKEIETYPLDDLELIYETQKELYSDEEMHLIKDMINHKKSVIDKKKKEIKKQMIEQIIPRLPEELICPKCEGPNPFKNDVCQFCGFKFDKSKYYSLEYNGIVDENIEQIMSRLPEELICPKCDRSNPFENDVCQFCGFEFDKSEYYYLDDNDIVDENDYYSDDYQEDRESHVFQYIISFIIPLVGFILGATLLSKDSHEDKQLGKSLIITGIVSIIISVCLSIVLSLIMISL